MTDLKVLFVRFDPRNIIRLTNHNNLKTSNMTE